MRHHRLSGKRFVLVFEEEDELVGELSRFAHRWQVAEAEFTGIGSLADVVLRAGGDERRLAADGTAGLDVRSLDGNLALVDGEARIDAYAVVAGEHGQPCGGRVLSAHVRSALKLVLTQTGGRTWRSASPVR
jgi:uncharacterized protein